MKLKGILSIVLCCLLIAGVFTGCNGGGSQSSTAAGGESKTASTAQTESKSAEQLSAVKLKWYVPGSTAKMTPSGQEGAVKQMNSLTEPEINATVDLQIIDFGDYETKMQMVIASGEEYDLCFTANWFNSFIANVSKGAFAPLNDLLTEYGRTLLDVTPDYGWDAITINGNIYAMHCRQNWNMSEGIYVRKDLADKYGFNPTGVVSMEELEALYQKMRDGEPKDFYPTVVDSNYRWPYYLVTHGFEEVAGRNVPVAYELESGGFTLVNQFATEAFREYCHTMKRFNDNGLIRNDSATYGLSTENITNDQKAGKIGTAQLGFVAPHVKAMAEDSWDKKYEAVTAQTTAGWAINTVIQSSLTAVSVNSKNKERAVMYYDLVVKSPELYNTLLWGVEGVNYTKVSDNVVKSIPDSGFGGVIPNWACGHQFYGWVEEGQDPTIWKQVEEWSSKGTPSGILGFVFDPEKVKTEIAACSSVVSEQLRMLDTGSVANVDTALDDFLTKLKTAGSDAILAEAQRQMDEWVKNKK